VKFLSQVLASASGSVGGITFSRNRFGPYTRRRAIPTNPNSPQQQAVRGFVNALANLWINTLTLAQRTAWEDYAANVTLIDALGQPINVTGMNMYVRSNTTRLQAALPRVDTGPVIFNLGEFTNPSFGFDAAATEIDVTFDDTDDWANEDDAAMIVYGSRPQNPTINFFKGPYQYADSILGDSITAPTSPAALTSKFAVSAGNRAFVKIAVSRADGRLSMPFRGYALSA
jgi:hypothetical protein